MICSAYRTVKTTSKKKKKRLEDKLLKGKWLLEKVPNQFSGGHSIRKQIKSQYYVSPFTNTSATWSSD